MVWFRVTGVDVIRAECETGNIMEFVRRGKVHELAWDVHRRPHIAPLRNAGMEAEPLFVPFSMEVGAPLEPPEAQDEAPRVLEEGSAVRPRRDLEQPTESEIESPLITHEPSHAWRTSTWTVGGEH